MHKVPRYYQAMFIVYNYSTYCKVQRLAAGAKILGSRIVFCHAAYFVAFSKSVKLIRLTYAQHNWFSHFKEIINPYNYLLKNANF